jgi:hypothetical protein
MGAILLGSAGQSPVESGFTRLVPIPENLPIDPIVLMEGVDRFEQKTPIINNNNYYTIEGGLVPEDTTIIRTDGLISQVIKETKVIDIIRDVDGLIIEINDGIYLKEIIRTDGVITSIDVTVL